MLPKEIELEKEIFNTLGSNLNIFPFNVTYTEAFGGLLSISFFGKLGLDDFLEKLGYKTLCDKSGFIIFEDRFTVILTNSSINLLLKLLENGRNQMQ